MDAPKPEVRGKIGVGSLAEPELPPRAAADVTTRVDPDDVFRKAYGLSADKKRNGWTGSLTLRVNDSPTVSTEFEATHGVRDRAIVKDVRDLLRPDVEAYLKLLGFVPEGAPRSGQLNMHKLSIDTEMPRHLGSLVLTARPIKATDALTGALLRAAEPTPMSAFDREVQRVGIRYDAAGEPSDIYLITYGWPTHGPGLNEENIHWSQNHPVRNELMNTELEHAAALPASVGLHFYAERLAKRAGT